MNCMQILITEATAAYSAAGMSDLFFIPEPMMTGTIVLDMTSRMPAELITEDLTTGISMSPARDDDDVDEEEDEDDDEDDEDDLDEEDDEDDEDDLDEEDDDELDDDDEDEH
jgi:hypothetical protein